MGVVTLSTTAAQVLLPNRLRKSFAIGNEDASIVVYLKQEKQDGATVSSTDHDIRLAAGQTLALSNGLDGEEAIKGRWTAIAASGTPLIYVFESEDIRR